MLRQSNRLAVLVLAAIAVIAFTACSPAEASSENTPTPAEITSPLGAAPTAPITGFATSPAPTLAPSSASTAQATTFAASTTVPSVAPTEAATLSPSAGSTVTSTTPSTSTLSSAVFPLKAATDTTLGQILVDGNGKTLYTNKNDTATTSACTDTCAQNWPPLTVPSGQTATLDQALSGQLGTLTRADGTTQVTYNGMPLHYYSGDHSSGDTNGQSNGGIWSVVVLSASSGSATPVSPGAGTTSTPYATP